MNKKSNQPPANRHQAAASEPEKNRNDWIHLKVNGSWDDHIDNTREAILELDRLTVEAESLATQIIITNAKHAG